MTAFTTKKLKEALTAKLMLNFGKVPEEATDQEMMKASALVIRDVMALREVETRTKTAGSRKSRCLPVFGVPDGPQPDEKRL